jgi:AraC-like DNA-binding protein
MQESIRDSQVKLVWTARIDYMPNRIVEEHYHPDYYQLLLVLEGEGVIHIGMESFPVQDGCFYILCQDVPHQFEFTKNTITLDYKFLISCPELQSWVHQQRPFGTCPKSQMEELKLWFKTSLAYKRKPEAWTPLRIDSGFKSTLISLFQTNENALQDSNHRIMQGSFPMAKYIEDHYQDKVTLEILSREFKFHPHYIIDMFRENVGVTPIQYLHMYRMQKAKELLEFTTLSISEIADHVGWTLQYFSRLFHKREGLSPTDYREYIASAIGRDIIMEDEFSNIRKNSFPLL